MLDVRFEQPLNIAFIELTCTLGLNQSLMFVVFNAVHPLNIYAVLSQFFGNACVANETFSRFFASINRYIIVLTLSKLKFAKLTSLTVEPL